MILDSLRNSASFNETDRAIATYLLNHTGDLKTLTMAKLAQETYTSNATIIRFCKKLGLSGYHPGDKRRLSSGCHCRSQSSFWQYRFN